MKLSWERSKDGYVRSKCSRFEIGPEPQGTTRAQAYYIVDRETGRRWDGDTQRGLKTDAQRVVDKEEREGERLARNLRNYFEANEEGCS
jgi:hypothetical protein